MFQQNNPYQYQPNGVPYGAPMMGMPMGYAQPQQTSAALNNFLTPEQMSEIQQYPQQFPTKLTRDEFLRSICTHKANGRIMLEEMNDGQRHCTICAKDFYLFELTTPDETIYGICKNMHDLLQSIKTYLLNAPDALKDIYMMLAFIEKLPLLWKSAVKTFEQVSNNTDFGIQNNNAGQDAWQMLGSMFGGGAGFYGQQQVPPMAMYQQPVYSQGYAQQPPIAPPQTPIVQQAPQGQPPVYGPNGYGFNANYVQGMQQPTAPAPAVPPMSYSQPAPPPGYPVAQAPQGGNPVGYVETPGVAQTQVTISPTNPGQQIPFPEQPVNPNLQSPVEKADVNKTFAPKA